MKHNNVCMYDVFIWNWFKKHNTWQDHLHYELHQWINWRWRVKMEWGIKGFKCMWRRLMRRFQSTKPKYNTLFRVTIILHKYHLNFSFEVIGEHMPNPLTTSGTRTINYRFKTFLSQALNSSSFKTPNALTFIKLSTISLFTF